MSPRQRVVPQLRHVSTRITLYFSLVFLVAMLVLLLVAGQLFSDRLTAEMNLVVGQKLGIISATLDHSLSEVRSLYFTLVNSPSLQFYMRNQNQGLEDNQAGIKAELSRLGQVSNVRSILMISTRLEVLDPVYSAPPYSDIVQDNPEFDRFLQSQLTGRFSAPSPFPRQVKDPQYSDLDTITYFGHYYDGETYQDLGYLAINLTRHSIFSELAPLFSSTFDAAYVVDEKGSVIMQTNPGFPVPLEQLLQAHPQGQVLQLDQGPYAVFTQSLPSYPYWRIVGFTNYQAILAPVKGLYVTVAAVAALVLALVVAASFSISHRITTPIRLLGEAMGHTGQGQMTEIPQPRTRDEISGLVEGFNTMVRDLKRLTGAIAAEQEEKKKIEVAMVRSQLDLLQSQINPHFIHNTLNTMKYMAKKQGNEGLAQLITSFNSLLRASMSTDNMMVTMLEEADNLRHYMHIQLERYDVDLDFLCDVSENAGRALLPKLILQPLVENSLFHGIVPKGGGCIRVIARTGEGRLWITVWDDGQGIPPETLRQLMEGVLPNARGYNQVGLANVSERLVLNYGDSSRLVVQSREGRGTTIGLSIPAPGCPDDSQKLY